MLNGLVQLDPSILERLHSLGGLDDLQLIRNHPRPFFRGLCLPHYDWVSEALFARRPDTAVHPSMVRAWHEEFHGRQRTFSHPAEAPSCEVPTPYLGDPCLRIVEIIAQDGHDLG